MSKHSLISAGLGLGLMAASLGASAQLHTFDYSSVYFGSAAGGSKYVAFVPTLTRGSSVASDSQGAAGVIMLELFQPASGSASTWGFAVAGAVGSPAGAGALYDTAGSTTASGGFFSGVSYSAANGISAEDQQFYFGNNLEQRLVFQQAMTFSSQACNVAFNAVIGTNDQLVFNNIIASPVGAAWSSAAAAVSITSGSAASNTVTVAQAIWNNASVTLPTYSFSGLSIADGAFTSTGTAAAGGMIRARNNCVPAYAARSAGSGTTITGSTVGLIRIW